MKSASDIVVFVVAETLSDNSIVYNVKLGQLTLNAVTQSDAQDLAEKISTAIADHTVNTTGVVDES
jgi:hypothetical protein